MLNVKVAGFRFGASGPVIPFLGNGPEGPGWEQVTAPVDTVVSPSAFDWRKVDGSLAAALRYEVEAFADKANEAIFAGEVPVMRGFVEVDEVATLRAEVARLTAQLAQVRSALA